MGDQIKHGKINKKSNIILKSQTDSKKKNYLIKNSQSRRKQCKILLTIFFPTCFFLFCIDPNEGHKQKKRTKIDSPFLFKKIVSYSSKKRKKKLPDLANQFFLLQLLQNFTVLPTKIFRRYVIKISSVIYLPTSSPMEYVRWLSFRR